MKIWHGPRSRSDRIVWLCEEMGLDYEIGLFRFREPNPEFASIDSLGSLPVLEDEGKVIQESVAIMLYLAGRYGPTPLMPAPHDPDFAECLQYLLLAEASLGSAVNTLMYDRFRCPEAERGGFHPTARHAQVVRTAQWVADHGLKDRPFVAGERFTLADICMGHSLVVCRSLLGMAKELPAAVSDYLDRVTARPAYQKVAALHQPLPGARPARP